MADQVRKMGFWEIGKKTKNALVTDVQSMFEQAQIEAFERKGKTSVILQIDIVPPSENQDARWGNVSFKTYIKVPKNESREFTVELVDGIAIGSGESMADMLQYSLKFPELDNVHEFPESGLKVQQ